MIPRKVKVTDLSEEVCSSKVIEPELSLSCRQRCNWYQSWTAWIHIKLSGLTSSLSTLITPSFPNLNHPYGILTKIWYSFPLCPMPLKCRRQFAHPHPILKILTNYKPLQFVNFLIFFCFPEYDWYVYIVVLQDNRWGNYGFCVL